MRLIGIDTLHSRGKLPKGKAGKAYVFDDDEVVLRRRGPGRYTTLDGFSLAWDRDLRWWELTSREGPHGFFKEKWMAAFEIAELRRAREPA